MRKWHIWINTGLFLMLVVGLLGGFWWMARQDRASRSVSFFNPPYAGGMLNIDANGWIRIGNNQWLMARNAAGTGNVYIFKVNTSDVIEAGADILLDDFAQGNMAVFHQVTSLQDDSEYALETGVSGAGWAQFGDNDDYCPFIFTSAGVVTLLTDATANCANTDTDAKAVIYDCGSGPCVKNRLAATKTVGINVRYFTP